MKGAAEYDSESEEAEDEYEDDSTDEGEREYYEEYRSERRRRQREDTEEKAWIVDYVKSGYGQPGESPGYLLERARKYHVVIQLIELGLGEDHTATSFAEYDSLYSQIEDLLELDDRDQFAMFLTEYHHILLGFGPQHILSLAVSHSAVGCLSLLLDSQLRSHVDLNQPSEALLHIAAYKLCLGMVTLLLQHGAEPHADALCGIPLELAIQQFRAHDFIRNWNPQKSITDLFNLISSPQMEESLETIKLLASQSKQVENLCFRYAAGGNIVEFATLLTVAADKLLAQPEKGLVNTPVGQYIFGELKCEANHLCERTSNGISSSKFKNLVDGFNLVKTFCFIHGLAQSHGQLVLEGASTSSDGDGSKGGKRYEEYIRGKEELKNKEAVIEYVKCLYGERGISLGSLLHLARAFNAVTQVLELGLGEDTGTCLADYNSIYTEIENFLELDDGDQFAMFLRSYHDKLLSFDPQHIFSLGVSHCAVGCLTALLDSQLRSHVDVNQPISNSFDAPLHVAASKLSFGMVTLLLQHGADRDVKLKTIFGIPLDSAIQKFTSHVFMLDGNPGKSIIELFSLISSPQMKESLDTVKMLASQTKEVENLCFKYVADGEFIKFATLLTVASDKLLAQLEKGLENTPVGQYICGELKCEANHLYEWTSNQISSPEEKNFVDAFNVVKTFCLINGLLERCGQLVLKEQRMGITGLSTLTPWSNFSYRAFCSWHGAHFNHKLVETRLSKYTLVTPSLVKRVVPIMWLVKRSIK